VVKVLSDRFPDLGEAALDTPIKMLVPEYKLILGDRYRTESVTFRDLLSHRTGFLPEASGIWAQAYKDSDDLY
jgi:CubicO group peptidase (beta-lactamase class C family)